MITEAPSQECFDFVCFAVFAAPKSVCDVRVRDKFGGLEQRSRCVRNNVDSAADG